MTSNMNAAFPRTDDDWASLPMDFNWNSEDHPLAPLEETIVPEPSPGRAAGISLLSECLRDGLQGISRYPEVDEMMDYLRLLDAFGIRYATVGIFPGTHSPLGARMMDLLARMRDELPQMVPSLLSLCSDDSLQWLMSCRDTHPGVQGVVFMGSAPSRRLVHGWSIDLVVDRLRTYIGRTVAEGIPVVAGTEHTTQTGPDDLLAILGAMSDGGASRVGLADTIGICRPAGAARITKFARRALDDMGAQDVAIDWHGHRDLGNALPNALAAAAAGADVIHVVARGVGERSGNASLEELALSLSIILREGGRPSPWAMELLLELVESYGRMVAVPAAEQGVLGVRYSHTSSGIHADAIFKAIQLADAAASRGDDALARKLRRMSRTVYSAVDPEEVGGRLTVTVSPWSGKNTVRLAHAHQGGEASTLSEDAIQNTLDLANTLGRELTDAEVVSCLANEGAASSHSASAYHHEG